MYMLLIQLPPVIKNMTVAAVPGQSAISTP